jgi:GTP-binding protein
VGRTNVGKSSLFNRLAGHRQAVVEGAPGITRDRLYAQWEVEGRPVLLVDTGGLVGAENDALLSQVREHATQALSEADVLLLVFDGQEGLVSLDYEVTEAARRSGKPLVPVANKMESGRGDPAEFAALGLGMPLPISALHNEGLEELEEAVAEQLPPLEPEVEEAEVPEERVALAIVGRPNVGKSALVNALLGIPRMIVSEIAGTTRDAVDTLLEWEGQWFQIVDTPGLRRRGKRSQGTEYYSSLRSLKALQRAEVGVVVFDAAEGFTQQDAAIALEVSRAGRALVIVANKWDLVHETAFADAELSPKELDQAEELLRADFAAMVGSRLRFAGHAPLLFTSALDGEGVLQLLPLVEKISQQFSTRVETGYLNRLVREAWAEHPPPSRRGMELKIRYVTQVATGPPTFVLFVNNPDLMHFSYERYLTNYLRESLGLDLVPLVLKVRRRTSRREA